MNLFKRLMRKREQINSVTEFSKASEPKAEPPKNFDLVELCSMWELRLMFCDGWFLIVEPSGEASPLSPEQAYAREVGYHSYQASQDVSRGGIPEFDAYTVRGFVKNEATDKWEYPGALSKPYIAEAVKPEGELIIPERIGPYPVTFLTRDAFADCKELIKVTLPKSLKRIEDRAFQNCSSLTSVQLQKKQVLLGKNVFDGTQVRLDDLTDADILGTTLIKVCKTLTGCYSVPNQIVNIAPEAFKDCAQLQKVILPEGVETIGHRAFQGCSALEEVNLPESLTELDVFAFENCEKLRSIVIPGKIRTLKRGVFKGCAELRNVTLPTALESIKSECFDEIGLEKDFLEGTEPALYIGSWLILWRSMEMLEVRPGTVGIADVSWTAKATPLAGVTLPDSLRYIGAGAFRYSTFSEIVLPGNLQRIGDAAFNKSRLRSVIISPSVRKLTKWTFMDCEKLDEIYFQGDTEIVFPAITGRKDKQQIHIYANSKSAEWYCKEYGARYNLVLHKGE